MKHANGRRLAIYAAIVFVLNLAPVAGQRVATPQARHAAQEHWVPTWATSQQMGPPAASEDAGERRLPLHLL